MKSVSGSNVNLAEFDVNLTSARCAELSEQLQHIRRAYDTRLSRGCAPADFSYLQQLISAIEAAQSVVENNQKMV